MFETVVSDDSTNPATEYADENDTMVKSRQLNPSRK
jgi:hypothetical protein